MTNFYCDILGGHIEKTQNKLTQIRIGDHLIDILELEKINPDNPNNKNGKNLEHFCLRITPFDIDNLKPYFASHEIQINKFGTRYGSQGMGLSFYILDPEGNEVELTELQSS
jgi:catechol-2,3-dioxygenase